MRQHDEMDENHKELARIIHGIESNMAHLLKLRERACFLPDDVGCLERIVKAQQECLLKILDQIRKAPKNPQ